MTELILRGWPFLGIALAFLMIAILFNSRSENSGSSALYDPIFLVKLMLPLYMIHQFEEHGYDIFGRSFPFLESMCQMLGFPDITSCPADELFILSVNVGTVWIAGIFPILIGIHQPLVGAIAIAIPFINGITHTLAAIRSHSYNPGLLTSLILFEPICFWILYLLKKRNLISTSGIVFSITLGILLHISLMGSLQLYIHRLLNKNTLIAIQIVNGFIPLLGWKKTRAL